eukprot:TRINITY_DN3976_c0_g1_i1.p1 TRINITY_DN3976_c0_g1~~TRINITY_DN3976_c0_g1_i1.p1  ORF type:complete len:169 (+),score=36.75 TRINITY_DN3976_c0_g1_i1:111-617(+)
MAESSAEKEKELEQQVVALEALLAKLKEQKSKGIVTQAEIAAEIFTALIDEQIEAVAFEVHRSVKLKLICPCSAPIKPGHVHQGLVNIPGYDIYGKKDDKQAGRVIHCPVCGRMKNTSKFAAHLEACMGMGGRESVRRTAAQRGRELIQQQAGNEARSKDPLPKRSKR